MKKLILIFIAVLTILSCGPALKSDGSFGSEEFVGRFRGIEIYKVITPNDKDLYIGIKGDTISVTSIHSQGKSTTTRTVIIDGVEYAEKAK